MDRTFSTRPTGRRVRAGGGLTAALLAAATLAACGGGAEDRTRQAGAERTTTSSSRPVETSTTSSTTTTTVPPPPSSSSTSTTASRPATTRPAVKATTATTQAVGGRDSETGEGAPLDLTGFTVVGRAPSDDAGLAALIDQLIADERAIRSDATGAEQLVSAAVSQQSAYRALAAAPELLSRVLALMPDDLDAAVAANVDAGAQLRSMTKPRTSLPPWKIVAPPPAAELEGYYREAETKYGVPWAYLAAVHLVESRMGRIRGTSTAGAQGPMQFMPATWAAYGEGGDINDPHDAILAAGRYLKRNGAAAGNPEGIRKGLYAYNHSDRYVAAVTAYAKEIEADRHAYLAYYHWQVFYITVKGDVLLPVGYGG